MTLDEACEKLNVTPNQLAKMFKPPLSRQAVWYWRETGIPELRKYQIKDMLKDINVL